MHIVKKNIVSILCGVIAILAVVALFWPISGMYADSQKTLEDRKKVFDDLKAVRTARRSLPVLSLDDASQQQPLKRFPSDPVIEEGNRVKDRVHQQADEMVKETVNRNRRQPLLPNVFPRPSNLRYQFGQEYMARVDALKKLLNSVTPPNDQEIQNEADKLHKDKFEKMVIKVAGQEVNRQQVEEQFAAAMEKLPQQLRQDRAEHYKMYLDDGGLPVSSAFAPGAQPKDDQIWYAQNQYWVEEDIANAISRINSKSKNVLESPVKQLVSMDLPDDFSQYLCTFNATPAGSDTPPAQSADELAGKAYTKSPTGRVCNPLYDVIKFKVVLNVDARLIPDIISEIQKGKLITVYQCDTNAVDAHAMVEQGYVYGPVPVVTLTLQCEELFMRDWTVPLMPDDVKKALSVPVDAAKPDSGQ